MTRIHFEPLDISSYRINGWVWSPTDDLSNKTLSVCFGAEARQAVVAYHRKDVEDVVGTLGLNAFTLSRRDSLWFLRNLDSIPISCQFDNITFNETTFTNRILLKWQACYAYADEKALINIDKNSLLNDLLSSSQAFEHQFSTVALFVARKTKDIPFLLEIIEATSTRAGENPPDFGSRYNQIRALVDLGCYEHAIQLFQLERTFNRPEEQAKAFSDLALASLGLTIDTTKPAGLHHQSSLPSTLEEAISLVYDPIYISALLRGQEARSSDAIPALILDNLRRGNMMNLNSTFDPFKYANEYNCPPESAAYDLLTDKSLLKSPFPGFDSKFVKSFYPAECEDYVHPYLFFLDNPGIFISPASYFNTSSKKQSQNSSPWTYKRVSGDLFDIFDHDSLSALRVDVTEKPAIHVLVPAFDIKSISAGFFGVFALAKFLSEIQNKYRVRLLFFMRFSFNKYLFEYILSQTTGLEDLLGKIDYQFLHPTVGADKIRHGDWDEVISLPTFSPGDKFVATVWFSAYFANELSERVAVSGHQPSKPFLYLIQDYEPGFHERSSRYIAAQNSYKFNYHALISSRPLYHQLTGDGTVIGPAAYFHNACAADRVVRSSYAADHVYQNSQTHKFLIYGRPEVPRNMFELTALTLQEAYKANVFDDSWEFYSAGLGTGSTIQLENDYGSDEVRCLPRMTLKEYQKFVGSCDICLTLMASPHPSLLPFDLAGSGCIVVTNSFQTKNESYFREFSPLILCRDPDPRALCEGIGDALKIVHDQGLRDKLASEFYYPCSWEETWSSDDVRHLLKAWVDA